MKKPSKLTKKLKTNPLEWVFHFKKISFIIKIKNKMNIKKVIDLTRYSLTSV